MQIAEAGRKFYTFHRSKGYAKTVMMMQYGVFGEN